MKRGKATVVWELLDSGGAQRLVVDVDAPLRPFGADPTPPYGIRFEGAADGGVDETLEDLVRPAPPPTASKGARTSLSCRVRRRPP